MKYATLGPIIEGTLLPEDLIPAFADALRDLVTELSEGAAGPSEKLYVDLIEEADKIEDFDSEEADDLLAELSDALQDFAPPYARFGAHEDDGASFGFWLSTDTIDEAVSTGYALSVSDPSEIPADWDGDVFVINDHGNISLYRPVRVYREVWAVV